MGDGLTERLRGVQELLQRDYDSFMHDSMYHAQGASTGVYLTKPESLALTLPKVIELVPQGISLHLGCANGGWALVAAAAGYRSFGIECNSHMLEHAQALAEEALKQGLIDVKPKYALGNLFPRSQEPLYIAAMKTAKLNEMDAEAPAIIDADPYIALGIQLSDAAVVYCFPWGKTRPYYTRLLLREAREDVLVAMLDFTPSDEAIANHFAGLQPIWPEPEFIDEEDYRPKPVRLWRKLPRLSGT